MLTSKMQKPNSFNVALYLIAIIKLDKRTKVQKKT